MPLRKNRITRKKHAPSVKLQPVIRKYMSEKLLGIIRHVLGFIGGIAVAKGWLTAEQLPGIVGGILAIIAAIWSVKSKGAGIPKAVEVAKVLPLLLLLGTVLLLPSCETPSISGDVPPVQAYMGTANVVGGEMAFGPHRLGAALTYRNQPDPTTPPPADYVEPITYPADSK